MQRVSIQSSVLALVALLLLSGCDIFNRPSPAPTNNSGGQVSSAVTINPPDKSPCIGVQPNANESIPTNVGTKQWPKPETVTLGDRIYCGILTTNSGRIVIELYPQVAPQNVNNFVFLAKQGYYENITWHRVLANFMAQTGDPTGTGGGGPGYTIPLEVNPAISYDREGRVGVARTSDPNSAGSQFFITVAPQPNLNPSAQSAGYTIIGQVVEGMTVVRQIKLRDPSQPNQPNPDPLISVRIVEIPAKK